MLKNIESWTTSQKIAFSFAFVIFTGSILLTLPISQLPTSEATYLDNLFSAVSMVCVTGLFTESIADSYTLFGQVVSMILIQIGGLGLMTLIASLVTQFSKNKIGFKNKLAVQEVINRGDARNFRSYIATIIKYTFVIEGIGMLLLSFYFVPELGWAMGLFTSLFLSISAFCNAGFDIMGNLSLIEYVHNPLINLVICALIILGGIGFSVWFDISNTFGFNRKMSQRLPFLTRIRLLTIHTRLAIAVTLFLLISGTIVFMIAEYTNEQSIGTFTFGEKLLASFFHTVTMRTAGFATLDYTTITPFSMFFSVITMFIGGSPGGTAGGLKTTTMAIIVLMIYNEARGQGNINVFYHTIPQRVVRQALIIFIALLTTLAIGTSLLLLLNPDMNPLFLLFEAVSALATVGVSANITPQLAATSQIVIMFLMFAGRIGPATLVDSIIRKNRAVKDIEYSKGTLIIG
ncbi:TrkH family potassium uptake protein [Jeotgalibaca caeni]|uniref:TrkH family potassium uptake protein n=1 Tax=Jeotgalibaca caeni TaxID=3028623 RepID=UPI00237EC0AC|nr:potassium transporter TrkG [Jeotgalibaca caeni]MDE1549346.1 potassium transporter TrkG [Jeotgalibaca caeni]